MTTDNDKTNDVNKLGQIAHLVTEDYYDPVNLGFDFESFFEKRERTPEEWSEYDMRIMGWFCRDFWKNLDPNDIHPFVLHYIAKKFYNVLAGDTFNNQMPLPWDPEDPVFSKAEQQGIEIFVNVANQLKADKKAKVTNVIASVAQDYNVSYETARAAYYKRVKNLPKDHILKRDKET